MKKFPNSKIDFKVQYEIQNAKLNDIYNVMNIIQNDFFRNEKADKTIYASVFNLLLSSVKKSIEYQKEILRGE